MSIHGISYGTQCVGEPKRSRRAIILENTAQTRGCKAVQVRMHEKNCDRWEMAADAENTMRGGPEPLHFRSGSVRKHQQRVAYVSVWIMSDRQSPPAEVELGWQVSIWISHVTCFIDPIEMPGLRLSSHVVKRHIRLQK